MKKSRTAHLRPEPGTFANLEGQRGKGMMPLVIEIVRSYSGWLILIFLAMLIETAMSIAAPWPLKIIIDNVVG